mgnify:CR=1 FL=1
MTFAKANKHLHLLSSRFWPPTPPLYTPDPQLRGTRITLEAFWYVREYQFSTILGERMRFPLMAGGDSDAAAEQPQQRQEAAASAAADAAACVAAGQRGLPGRPRPAAAA